MAHRQTDRIPTRGDAHAVSTVAGYFIIELMASDRRVNDLYAGWRMMHEKALQAGLAAIDVPQMRPDRNQAEADAVVAGLEQATADFSANELAAMQRFVRDELKLPWTLVAHGLLDAFRTRRHNELHPEDERTFGIPVAVADFTPTGKRPARDGEDLKRDVRWFYRAEVKQPPDSKRSIEREYRSWANRDTDSYSVVKNAIDHVRRLLDLAEKRYVVQQPGYVVTRNPDDTK